MKVLGLDPSVSSTGYSVVEYPGPYLLEAGCLKTDPGSPLIERYVIIQDCLANLLNAHDFQVVGIESPAGYSSVLSSMLYGVYIVCLLTLRSYKRFVVEIGPGQLKALLGVKTSRKSEVVIKTKEFLGWPVKKRLSSDICDSVMIGYYAYRFSQFYLDSSLSLTPLEKRVFASQDLNNKGQMKGIIHRKSELFHDFNTAVTEQSIVAPVS